MSDQELRERYGAQVQPFVERMYIELAANAHKGDRPAWLSMSLRQAWGEISWHSAKLAAAIKATADGGDPDLIRELAADVANGAMMLTDILDQIERAMVAEK